jgi:F0F1-type ATP synthase beta subunit
MVEELHRRLAGQDVDLLIVFLIRSAKALLVPGTMPTWPEYPPDISAGVATVWLSCDDADAPHLAEQAPGLGEARPTFSRRFAARSVYPAIDPHSSRSNLLQDECVSRRHLEIVAGLNQLIAKVEPFRTDTIFDSLLEAERDEESTRRDREVCRRLLSVLGSGDREALLRVLRLERYLAQPFFCRERQDHRQGTFVTRPQALEVCEDILWGAVSEVDLA